MLRENSTDYPCDHRHHILRMQFTCLTDVQQDLVESVAVNPNSEDMQTHPNQ